MRRNSAPLALFSVAERGQWTSLFRLSAILRNALLTGSSLITDGNFLPNTTWPEFQPSLPPGQPVLIPEVTKGRGAVKVWRPCTPAMAAGVTDHVWSLKDVLRYRLPPWPQAQTV